MAKNENRQAASHVSRRMYIGRERFGFPNEARGRLGEWVLSLTLDGRARYQLEDTTIFLSRNDALLLRPGVNQHWQVEPVGDSRRGNQERGGCWSVAYAIFTPPPAWLSWMNFPMTDKGYFHTNLSQAATVRRAMASALIKANRLSSGGQERHRDLMLHLIGEAVLWLREGSREAAEPVDSRLADAVMLMNRRLDSSITLEDLGEAAMLSRSQFSLIFKKQFGMPPLQYFEWLRIERAKQMLSMTPHPIKHISRAVGFEDPRYFIKRFRLHAGKTPRQYRDQVRSSE